MALDLADIIGRHCKDLASKRHKAFALGNDTSDTGLMLIHCWKRIPNLLACRSGV